MVGGDHLGNVAGQMRRQSNRRLPIRLGKSRAIFQKITRVQLTRVMFRSRISAEIPLGNHTCSNLGTKYCSMGTLSRRMLNNPQLFHYIPFQVFIKYNLSTRFILFIDASRLRAIPLSLHFSVYKTLTTPRECA